MDTVVILTLHLVKMEIPKQKSAKISLAINFLFECILFKHAVIFGNRTTLEKFFAGLIVDG